MSFVSSFTGYQRVGSSGRRRYPDERAAGTDDVTVAVADEPAAASPVPLSIR